MSPAKKLISLLGLLVALVAPAPAGAAFGLVPGQTTVTAQNRDGTIDEAAGSHPATFTVHFELNTDESGAVEGGEMRDALVDLPVGFVGNPHAVPTCSRQDFDTGSQPQCAPETQVGILGARTDFLGHAVFAVYNIAPPPGVAAMFGFSLFGNNVLQYASVRTEEGYALRVAAVNAPLEVNEVEETIWGVPADPANDSDRECLPAGNPEISGCTTTAPLRSYLTLPAQCDTPLRTRLQINTKADPGNFVSEIAESIDSGGTPAPLTGCDAVPFAPEVASQPTSKLAANPSGLDFTLKLPNQGLESPGGIAETEPHKIEVTLPEGVTANPSAAEGLATCSEAQYKAEQIDTAPGAGCPEASKLGSIVAHSPLLEEPVEGALYLATPYQNPEGTLIGLYLVFRAPERGVLLKQSAKVVPDPKTGQLVTTLEGLPPLPYSDATLHFREGARGVLVTPGTCGRFATTAKLYPFSEPNTPVTKTSYMQIERGVNGGPCPSGGEPFNAGFEAGSENNQAGAYSPFYLRLTRQDGDQDLTKFSSKLPPGVVGRLAGTAQCSDAAIAQARSRTGSNGGHEELADPSCPASSEIGRTIAGAGVGGVLTYVPGKLYLAGPYNGAPLSVVAVTPGVAGPFDVGTIVVRQALRINPLTVEVEADGSSSDPIPHILKGIPLAVRDLRVYVDKPDFTLNPTSCDPLAAKATLFSGGANVFSSLDDSAHALQARFQAASCASLDFKPKLGLTLTGGTRRGGHPALRGVFSPRQGNANTKKLVLRLPRSAFLDQSHIRTICTRVQFNAGAGNGAQCPAGAIYGHATAWSPLVEEPLTGPVFLRSSNHNLPDFVAALHGIVDVEATARIDSKHGGIRATFTQIPDAPLSKVVVDMQGGNKGLIVNSTNLCAAEHRANIGLEGHNGKRQEIKPVVTAAGCGGKRKHKRHPKS